MATELATAYINLVPSARGMKAAIQKELGDAGVSGGATASNGFTAKFKSGIGNLAGFAATTLKTGLVAGGAAGGALLAVALKGGYDRLVTIQNATRALTIQLGSSAAAADLLKNVLQVVKGTPFPLDQFAAAAQNLSAMGIEASKIPGYLTAIGDVASTKGSQAGEYVDRLTLVFGQIHAQGKIMGQDLLQIAQAGVPALTILANHFGVNTAEMQKMISKGAVPADQAIQVLADGIEHGSTGAAGQVNALAGTMKSLGTTTSGAWSNTKAALSRFGVALLQPAFNAAPKVLGRITDAIDSVTASVGPMLDKFTHSTAVTTTVESISDAFSKVDLGSLMQRIGTVITGTIVPAFTSMAQQIGPLIPKLVSAGQVIGTTIVAAVQKLAPVIAQVVPWLARIATAFGEHLAGAIRVVVPPLADIVKTGAELITKVPVGVVVALAAAFAGFVVAKAGAQAISGLADKARAVKKDFTDAKDAASKFASGVRNVGSNVADAAKSLGSGAKSAALWAKQGLLVAANWVKATAAAVAQKVALVAQAAAEKVAAAAQWLLNVAMDANPITLIIIAIVALIAGLVLLATHVKAVGDFFVLVWHGIQVAISAVWNWIKANWPLLLGILTGPIGLAVALIVKNWDTIKNSFTAVKDWIGARVSDVVGFITGIPGRIAGVASTAFNALRDAMTSAKNWIGDRVNDIVGFFAGLPGRMGGLFAGMFDGIKDALRSAWNWVANKWNSIHLPSVDIGPVHLGGGGLPQLPTFATGGQVPGSGPVPIVAHGGEYVLSADVVDAIKRGAPSRGLGSASLGGGGAVVNFEPGAVLVQGDADRSMVYRAVNDAVNDALRSLNRGIPKIGAGVAV